jgi:hypothetical protein
MNTADACPDRVAGAEVIDLPIGSRFHTPADNVVGLFKRMVVRVNLGAGHILNEEQRLVYRAEGAIHEHLDGNARSGVEAFHLGGCARPRQL